MNVGVIGYGVVGGATAELLRRLGHRVMVSDSSPAATERALSDGFASLGPESYLEVVFLCVPETEIEAAVFSVHGSPVTVIRSTVPPGTTDRLSEALGRSLVHMPEFLKESTALWDVLNPNFVLIGCRDQEQAKTVAQIFEPMLVPVTVVPPPTSEMVKLALNSYLHTLISFWNEIHMICDRTEISSHQVGRICSQDPRVAAYGANMHAQPAGGRCLPKDIAQLISFSEDRQYKPGLLKAAQQVNRKLLVNNYGKSDEPQHLLEWLDFQAEEPGATPSERSNGTANQYGFGGNGGASRVPARESAES